MPSAQSACSPGSYKLTTIPTCILVNKGRQELECIQASMLADDINKSCESYTLYLLEHLLNDVVLLHLLCTGSLRANNFALDQIWMQPMYVWIFALFESFFRARTAKAKCALKPVYAAKVLLLTGFTNRFSIVSKWNVVSGLSHALIVTH